MNRIVRASCGALLAAGLAACADLDTTRLDVSDKAAVAPLKGQITYFLPRTAISVAMSVSVIKCDGIDTSDDPAQGDLKLKVTGTPTPLLLADPAFGYRIDYSGAEGWMKEIQFTVNTTPGKVFQSFNGQINDQVGPTAVAAVTAMVQIVGAAVLPGAAVARNAIVATTPRQGLHIAQAVPQQICSAAVDAALQRVASDQAAIKQLQQRVTNYYTGLATGAVTPSKDDPTTAWSQAITALNADITGQQTKALTHTWTVVWTPDAGDFVSAVNSGGEQAWLATHQFPVSQYVVDFLLHGGPAQAQYQAVPAADDPNRQSWLVLHQPLVMKLVVDPTTFFDAAHFVPTSDMPTDPLSAPHPGGLLVRDPANGLMQKCTPSNPALPLVAQDKAQSEFVFQGTQAQLAGLCPTPSFTHAIGDVGTSGGDDDKTRISVSLPQLGRPLVFTAHSGIWENASLSVTLNSDGTLQSVGTHDVGTAATGLTGLAGAAGAAAQAQAARNTAIGAVNTATTTQLQLPDTINKATADCYTQAASIVKAGGTPVSCQ